MSCGGGPSNNCCPPPCCPPACCPPIVIKTKTPQPCGQCCVFQLPPVNIVCEIPPPPKKCTTKVCCIPLVMTDEECPPSCCPQPCCPQPCCPPPPCCIPIDFGCPQRGGAGGGCCRK